MVLKLVKEDLKQLLDKNAGLMCLMAFVFSFMTSFPARGYGRRIGELENMLKLEGSLVLLLIFLGELAKRTLIQDKAGKKIEFFLANGLSRGFLIKKYMVSLLVGALVILLPGLLINFSNMDLSPAPVLNFLGSCLLYPVLLVLAVLYTVNMNRLNGLQWGSVLFSMGVTGLSLAVCFFTNMIELYLISKFVILGALLVFLGIRTKTERIVVSYY